MDHVWRSVVGAIARMCVLAAMAISLGIAPGHAQNSTTAGSSEFGTTNQSDDLPPPGTAIERTVSNLSDLLNQVTAELDRLDRAVERTRRQDGDLAAFRESAEAALDKAIRIERRIRPERADIASQYRRLGPEPEKDAPPEALVLRTERKRLAALRDKVGDIAGASKILQERARQLVALIQGYRRTSFRRQLLERSASPLSPAVWQKVTEDAGARFRQLGYIFQTWWKSIRADVTLALVLAGLILAIVFLRRRAAGVIEQYRNHGYAMQLDLPGRATSAFLVFLARAVPPVCVASGIYLAVSWFSDMPDSFARMAKAALWSFSLFAVVRALIRTVLAANHAEWRLFRLSDEAALKIGNAAVAIAGVYAAGLLLHEFIEVIYAPDALRIILNGVVSIALGALLLFFVSTPFTLLDEDAAPTPIYAPFWLKGPLFLSALTIIGATLLGYIDLARFLSSQVVVTGALVAVAAFCCAAVDEISRAIVAQRLRSQSEQAAEPEAPTEAVQRLWVGGIRWVLNAVVILATIGFILLQWGFDWGDMIVWLRKVFFGFEVGAIRISPAAIAIGVGLFVAGIFLTRLLQRSLSNTLLAPNRMDHGLSNSIRTGVGYAGFALSAIVAVSYAGFNFTNLAIVAGALSVGIGFGLQSIVNNFVSGLILLAERPIQVGDWIVVGDKEGYVRRISVRATVIETFDRASLIIPNSDLMTAAVTNWTYGNRLGRVVVTVGTSYETDPQFVYETLLDIGRNCTLALNNPPPSVVFQDFADSTLNFSLRIYIADINNIVRAQTELRMDIWKVFREKEISIDFPQLDVHIKRG